MDDRLESYLQRVLPEFLREGAAAPAAWDGTPEAWEELRREAALAAKRQAVLRFVQEVSLGIRPYELAAGEMPERRADGTPVRPPAPTITSLLETEARDVLKQLNASWLTLPEPPLQRVLEMAAASQWQGEPRRVVAAVQAGKALLAAKAAEAEAARREDAERPVLTVSAPFRGPGGTSYAPGAYPVDPAVAAELMEWQAKMEGQARQHGWDAPEGYDASWPPFSVTIP